MPVDALMRAYLLDVFAERDPARRMAALQRTCTEDVVFADAEGVVVGHEAVSAKAQAILAGAEGLEFRAAGEARQVQDLGYLAWELGPAGGPAVVAGADMGFARDGRLARVYTVLFT